MKQQTKKKLIESENDEKWRNWLLDSIFLQRQNSLRGTRKRSAPANLAASPTHGKWAPFCGMPAAQDAQVIPAKNQPCRRVHG